MLTSNGYASPTGCVESITRASKAVDVESSLVSAILLARCFTHAGCCCTSMSASVVVPSSCPIYICSWHQQVICGDIQVKVAVAWIRKQQASHTLLGNLMVSDSHLPTRGEA